MFAFTLLDCANHARRNDEEAKWKQGVRLLRVALKAAKSCLEVSQLEWCTKVMEKAADHEEQISRKADEGDGENKDEIEGEERRVYERLRIEYWNVRIALVSLNSSKGLE